MKYIAFLRLCWRAYNGDIGAAIEVAKILKERVGA